MSLKEFKKSCVTDDEKKFMELIEEQTTIETCPRQPNDPDSHEKMQKLYKSLHTMCDAQDNHEIALSNGIFQTIHYLTDDLDNYFKDNYLITFLLIYLQTRSSNKKEQQHLQQLLIEKNDLQINNYVIPFEIVQSVFERIPIFHQILNKVSDETDVTMYDLLDGYENIDVKKLFEWRFKNKTMPHFSQIALVNKYGFKETLNYMYYLKESRPNMAIMHLKRYQNKTINQLSLPMCVYFFSIHTPAP